MNLDQRLRGILEKFHDKGETRELGRNRAYSKKQLKEALLAIKQAFKESLPEKKEYMPLENLEGRHNIDGRNQAIEEMEEKLK